MIPRFRKYLMSTSQFIIQKKPTHHNPLCCSISELFFSSLRTSEEPIAFPTAEFLTIQHQFSPKAASKASSAIPFLENPQLSDSVLSFLTEIGFSKAHLEKLISKFPQVLSANPSTIEPNIKVFLDSGFSSSEVANIVSSYPWTLNPDLRPGSTISAMKSILVSNDAVLNSIKRSATILRRDLGRTVIPNIEYLESRGIGLSQIRNYFGKFPRVFLLKPASLVEKVRRVEEMGFDMNSTMLMEAIRVVSSMTLENWELKLDAFRRVGYSEDEILRVFRQTPQVFCVSEQKMKESIRAFVTEGGVDFRYLVKNSLLLGFSVDARVRPRLQVMEILRKKQLLTKTPMLKTIMSMSRKIFLEKFVLPYSEALGDDLVASLS